MAAIGQQRADQAWDLSTALLPCSICVIMRAAQGGAATALCKIRLAAWQRASKAPTPFVPLCSHLIRATKSRGLSEAVGLRSPADFRGSLNCSHLVLASTQPQR